MRFCWEEVGSNTYLKNRKKTLTVAAHPRIANLSHFRGQFFAKRLL